MMLETILYAVTGLLLFGLGLRSAVIDESFIRKVIALNVMGTGVFMVFIAIAYRGPQAPADPVPHALVLTGIVVAVSATALLLALARRLEESDDE